MDSAEAAANAPASASGTAAEGQSGSWVDNMSGWMEDVEAPATNASGPESARNEAAARAAISGESSASAPAPASEPQNIHFK